MFTPETLRIVIVGAGPVGLIAATSLAREGHSVTVLERRSKLQTNGGTIVIQCPASRALIDLGLEEQLRSISVPNRIFNFWSYSDPNKPMAEMIRPPGSDMVHTDRPALQRMAYDAAINVGVTVLFNKQVDRLDEYARPLRLWTVEGVEYNADLVIGADGIKSKVRRLMFPSEPLDPVATNECIFQAELGKDITSTDPRLAPYMSVGSGHVTLGPGCFSFLRCTSAGKLYLLFTVVEYGSPEADMISGSWNLPGDVDEVRRIFSRFDLPLSAALERMDSCQRWRIAVAAPIKSWRGPSGRTLLMGDAAHAMVPHAAQGVSQGIEDAVALARILRWRGMIDDNVPELLEHYERFRRPRVEKFARLALVNAKNNVLADGPEQEARDERLKAMGRNTAMASAEPAPVSMDENAPPHSPEFQKWVHDYIVSAEVDGFMSRVAFPDSLFTKQQTLEMMQFVHA